jgi:hypothetical protein
MTARARTAAVNTPSTCLTSKPNSPMSVKLPSTPARFPAARGIAPPSSPKATTVSPNQPPRSPPQSSATSSSHSPNTTVSRPPRQLRGLSPPPSSPLQRIAHSPSSLTYRREASSQPGTGLMLRFSRPPVQTPPQHSISAATDSALRPATTAASAPHSLFQFTASTPPQITTPPRSFTSCTGLHCTYSRWSHTDRVHFPLPTTSFTCSTDYRAQRPSLPRSRLGALSSKHLLLRSRPRPTAFSRSATTCVTSRSLPTSITARPRSSTPCSSSPAN